jgi:hypothetical protein
LRRGHSAWIVAALVLAAGHASAQGKPKLLPDRDVDISYRVTDRTDKATTERARWLSASHLQRIDGTGNTVVLADRSTDYITILNPSTRSYVKIEEPPDGLFRVDDAAVFTQGSTNTIAHVACTDWSWLDASTHKPRTVCMTDDGVMLRTTEDGRTLIEATSVTYRRLKPATFQIPSGYSPTLVPDVSAD